MIGFNSKNYFILFLKFLIFTRNFSPVKLTQHLKDGGDPSIESEVGAKLAKVYSHPDDIDLWIGGLMEESKTDALVGPTFSDIIADQFSRFRKGDRYFFEHDPSINPGAFTTGQLQQVRLSSSARIICDNADCYGLTSISPHAFLLPNLQGNVPVSCADSIAIPVLDYNYWKE